MSTRFGKLYVGSFVIFLLFFCLHVIKFWFFRYPDGYTDKDLIYKWTDEDAIGMQEGVEIAQFDLVNVTTQKSMTMVKGGLPYSTIKADFWLKRHTGYFMLQVYVFI